MSVVRGRPDLSGREAGRRCPRRLGTVFLAMLCTLAVCPLMGCSSSPDSYPSVSTTDYTDYEVDDQDNPGAYKEPSPDYRADDHDSTYSSVPTYEDERWPTNNPSLLAIPESDRWYNARSNVGTYCTVAGPVVDVNYAENSRGKPVFVCIGAAYPSQDCVELVIWTEGDWSAFSELLTALYQYPDCWLSVTGYLQSYEGYMQFNSADGVQFRWWTNVS